MTMRQCLSAAVIVALVSGLTPATTWANDSAQASGDRKVDLRSAIDRAAARAATDRRPQVTVHKDFKTETAVMQGGGGGGGGHMMAIVSLISVVGGLAATYYVIKQTQKVTSGQDK